MKNHTIAKMMLGWVMFFSLPTSSFGWKAPSINEKPFVIPEITEWKGGQGNVALSGRIIVKSSNIKAIAQAFSNDCEEMFGWKLAISSGKPRKGDIVLTCRKSADLSDESYQIEMGTVSLPTVNILSSSPKGMFWATRTLLQLFEQSTHDRAENISLPSGTIIDKPQYPLRGFMIDVGRKYIPMSYLRNLVKVMAYYKMNTLQVHLNDNGMPQYFESDWNKTPAAFRLECNTYPGLTATDGSYSKAEFIAFQQLGEQHFVEIIPEIDSPAHALAFTHFRPSLGSKEYGMDHFNLSNPEVYTFMDSLFAEYLGGKNPVFRGHRVNIGTDEYSNRNPQVVEQFRAYTDHYLALIENYGKQPMLWGALTHARGNTPVRHEGVLMNCWYNGYAQPDSMRQLGYQMVSIPDGLVYIVPAAGYYYDYLNCKHLYENWTPAQIGNKRFEEQDPQIEGGMFAVWNDHYGNGISVKDIHHRAFPAIQTIATKTWTGQLTTLPYDIFDEKRMTLSEAPGVNELGRLPHETIEKKEISPNSSIDLPIIEAGYDYRVSFSLDCKEEEKGTVLFESDHAIFYLSSPTTGQVGFSRDGYLNTFNYKLPVDGHVDIRIEGTNKETRLYVNNRHIQTLSKHEVYVMKPSDKLNNMPRAEYQPTVFAPSAKMYYVPTLVFPLQRTGNYRSQVTNLKVEAIHANR